MNALRQTLPEFGGRNGKSLTPKGFQIQVNTGLTVTGIICGTVNLNFPGFLLM